MTHTVKSIILKILHDLALSHLSSFTSRHSPPHLLCPSLTDFHPYETKPSQGLCTWCFLCPEFPLSDNHMASAQMSPLLYFFFIALITTYHYIFICLFHSTVNSIMAEGFAYLVLFCPQNLEWWLVYNRYSINIHFSIEFSEYSGRRGTVFSILQIKKTEAQRDHKICLPKFIVNSK